jgi:cobalamin biosynthesis protein CobD/CbiB
MAMKTLWSKVEPILWFLATVYLCLVAYGVLLYPAKFWAAPFWGRLLVYVIIVFWWTAFKSRLAKFLRESLREMIAEELAESRVAFVEWLREDAPWRGENPFPPRP